MPSLLAQRLKDVLAGTAALQDVLSEQQIFVGTPEACFTNLQHYLADDDIRKSDSEYMSMQNNEMMKLIHLLEIGASDADIASISFVDESRGSAL